MSSAEIFRAEHRPDTPGRRGSLVASALLLATLLAIFAPPHCSAAEPVPADWQSFQSGLRLFKERRLGEALDAFKAADQQRAQAFGDALRDIDIQMKDKAAARAGDSIWSLIHLVAPRDVISYDLAGIDQRSGGSLLEEIRLLLAKNLSFDFDNFLKAARLVLSTRGEALVGDSLAKLRESASALRSYPESDYWIGKIYLAEGETRLAEMQFRQAYDEREAFDSPDQVYVLLESLARLYRDQGKMNEYESSLLSITGEAVLFAKKSDYLRLAMERTLSTRGIDTFLSLYRLDEAFPLRAYSELGAFYLENGRSPAVIYLAAAVDTELSRCISSIKEYEPAYQFGGLAELMGRIRDDHDLSSYAAASGLYRDLERLG